MVGLDEFSSLFKKCSAHSHSRQQQTSSNFPRITLKDKLRVSNEWILEGVMYINISYIPRGHSDNFCFVNFSEYWWSNKTIHRDFIIKFITHYQQKPLYIIFHYGYQKYIYKKMYFGFQYFRPNVFSTNWFSIFHIWVATVVFYLALTTDNLSTNFFSPYNTMD